MYMYVCACDVRLLVALLTESQSPTAIAVAAHDLGEYVRYYPRGKRLNAHTPLKSIQSFTFTESFAFLGKKSFICNFFLTTYHHSSCS